MPRPDPSEARGPNQSAGRGAQSDESRRIGGEYRSTLAALADLLIPAGDNMPSASAADVSGGGLDALLGSRPDLAHPLVAALRRVAHLGPAEALALLRAEVDGAAYAALTDTVVGAYFMNPEVLARLGYSGQRRVEIPNPSLDVGDDALVSVVAARGPIFRQ